MTRCTAFQRLLLAIGLLSLLGIAPSAAASRGAAAVSVEDVAKRLMDPCPDCKGKLLAGCECGGARQAKEEIRALLAAGNSEDEVVEAFRQRYGEWVLAVPEQKGFNRLGYLLPAALFLGGAIAVGEFLRRAAPRRRRRLQAAGSAPSEATRALTPAAGPVPSRAVHSSLSAAERERLEQELQLLDS